MAAPKTVMEAGSGIHRRIKASKRRGHELNDPGPQHRRSAHLPRAACIVRPEIHRQHEGQRVRKDCGNIIAIDMRCPIPAILTPGKADSKVRNPSEPTRNPNPYPGSRRVSVKSLGIPAGAGRKTGIITCARLNPTLATVASKSPRS